METNTIVETKAVEPVVADAPPASAEAVPTPTRARRGFATLDPARVREIASKGGKAAHAAGTAHQFTSDEARVAGRRGGQASNARRRERAIEGTTGVK